MSYGKSVLLTALINPNSVLAFSELELDALVFEARAQKLLAQVGGRWPINILTKMPFRIQQHYSSEKCVAEYVNRSVKWEIERIYEALKKFDIKIVLLKGSAYSLADLDVGYGRIYQDIDILVGRDQICLVESILFRNGWIDDCKDEYDQKYYRFWMHELPPRRNIRTGAVLDIHHNIIPLTSRYCPNVDLIFKSSVAIKNTPYYRLCDEDMVLHSASHLFLNGEFDHGLRDLYDLDALFCQFSRENEKFWHNIMNRSDMLMLDEVLYYAVFYTTLIIHTPIPEHIINNDRFLKIKKRGYLVHWALNKAFKADFSYSTDISIVLAKWLLFVRAHWIKMPWYLLIPHLSRKAWMRLTEKDQH